MDARLEMDKGYAFPYEKLKPCPARKSSEKPPAVIAICGAFNPLHRAHLALYDAACHALEKDGRPVLGGFFSPVADAYGKPGLLDVWKRIAVALAIVESHPSLMVDTWEARQPEYTRTYYVLAHLQEQVHQFYHEPVPVVLACGEDLYKSFFIPGVWPLDVLSKLLETFQIVVIAREEVPGTEADTTVTVLEGRNSDGSAATLDLSQFSILKTSFATPDNTCSSEVRSLVEASPDEPTAIHRIAPLVCNHKAAALICRFYGSFQTPQA